MHDDDVVPASPAPDEFRGQPVVLLDEDEATHAPDQQLGELSVARSHLEDDVARARVQGLDELATDVVINKEVLAERALRTCHL